MTTALVPGWGTSGWGTDQWGTGLGLPMFLADAYAYTTNSVRVVLSVPPLASSPITTGDALNIASWEVKRVDTGEVFTLLQVNQIDPVTFELITLEALAPVQIAHSVRAVGLLDANGEPIGSPSFQTFPGLLDFALSTTAQQEATRQLSTRDLLNPQASPVSAGGTLIIGSDGDYANESGAELVKKLILRRLTTPPGAFFHLPTYGVGLREKSPLPGGTLPQLQALIQQQVLMEPEVQSVQVILSLNAALGILNTTLRVILKRSGQMVPISFPTQILKF